jgi:hypothetical protein
MTDGRERSSPVGGTTAAPARRPDGMLSHVATANASRQVKPAWCRRWRLFSFTCGSRADGAVPFLAVERLGGVASGPGRCYLDLDGRLRGRVRRWRLMARWPPVPTGVGMVTAGSELVGPDLGLAGPIKIYWICRRFWACCLLHLHRRHAFLCRLHPSWIWTSGARICPWSSVSCLSGVSGILSWL